MSKDPFDEKRRQRIPIGDIAVLTDVQPRTQKKDSWVTELIEATKRGDVLPPLCVFREPDTKELVLASGFHRHEAHRIAGAPYVWCLIASGSRNDARLYAIGTNAKHGLYRTTGDKRRVADRALSMKPGWSDRTIGKLCNVSHTFVADRRRQMFDDRVGNVATRHSDGIRDGEVVFDVTHECNNLQNDVRKIAGRCDLDGMKMLIHTLHELCIGMTKRRERMAADTEGNE